jgi:hypothetical protein
VEEREGEGHCIFKQKGEIGRELKADKIWREKNRDTKGIRKERRARGWSSLLSTLFFPDPSRSDFSNLNLDPLPRVSPHSRSPLLLAARPFHPVPPFLVVPPSSSFKLPCTYSYTHIPLPPLVHTRFDNI